MTDSDSSFASASEHANGNIDSQLLGTGDVFVDNNNDALVFFIPVNEQDRSGLTSLIEAYGGKVSADPGKGYYLSKFADPMRDVVDPKFVYDSINKKALQKVAKYKVYPTDSLSVSIYEQQQHHHHHHHQHQASDSKQDQHVQDQLTSFINSETPETHSSNEVTNLQLLAQSNTGGLVISHSKPIKSGNNKNGFTPEEDAMILEEVRRNPHRRSTHNLFKEIATKIGRHTGNSIRYRYRAHLSQDLNYVYKLDDKGEVILDAEGKPVIAEGLPGTIKNKFTANDDYELCKTVREILEGAKDYKYEEDPKDIILPGKFFENMENKYPHHTRAAWRDRYRKFAIPYGIDKYIKYYDEEKSNNREPDEIKNFTGKNLYKSSKKYKNGNRTNDDALDDEIGERLDSFNKKQSKKRKIESHGEINENDPNNIFLAGNHDDLAGMSSNNLFVSHAAAAVAAASNKLTSTNAADFLTEDLVTEKFFSFQPLISVVDKLNDIVNRNYDSGDADQLIDALYTEAGIQKKFGMFIITSVCGDLILIPKYIEIFLKTGENPPQNVHGIWTQRDDEYLKSDIPERLDYLKRLHGAKRIELRKSFINNDYV